jgi:flagellar biosynthesis/type III secretory pathway protein FliH
MSEEKRQLDIQSLLVTAKREGMREGMQKGEEKGMQKEKQKIIDLLKSGKSPEEILKDYDMY